MEILSIFRMSSHPAQTQSPRRNAKPPIENFLVTVLPKPRRQRQTTNESVGCFDWFITWFTGLRGNKWNRTIAEQ